MTILAEFCNKSMMILTLDSMESHPIIDEDIRKTMWTNGM